MDAKALDKLQNDLKLASDGSLQFFVDILTGWADPLLSRRLGGPALHCHGLPGSSGLTVVSLLLQPRLQLLCCTA